MQNDPDCDSRHFVVISSLISYGTSENAKIPCVLYVINRYICLFVVADAVKLCVLDDEIGVISPLSIIIYAVGSKTDFFKIKGSIISTPPHSRTFSISPASYDVDEKNINFIFNIRSSVEIAQLSGQ